MSMCVAQDGFRTEMVQGGLILVMKSFIKEVKEVEVMLPTWPHTINAPYRALPARQSTDV